MANLCEKAQGLSLLVGWRGRFLARDTHVPFQFLADLFSKAQMAKMIGSKVPPRMPVSKNTPSNLTVHYIKQ